MSSKKYSPFVLSIFIDCSEASKQIMENRIHGSISSLEPTFLAARYLVTPGLSGNVDLEDNIVCGLDIGYSVQDIV